MGSMMARSTPRALFHSPFAKYGIVALEGLAALFAVSLFITLCAMHVRFVRREGCSSLLKDWELGPGGKYLGDGVHVFDCGVAPVVELSIAGNPPHDAPQSFRFSHERGFLLLSDNSLHALNVSVAQISLSRHHLCLGDPVSRFLLFHVLGYDVVAINAFARMRRRMHSKHGYVLSVHSRRVLNLVHADPGLLSNNVNLIRHLCLKFVWKLGAVITAVFIMCTTGALVAFTLKEVQLRMLKLTMDLQMIMRSQLGYGRIILHNALDALVFVPIIAGMLFFLFEFFDDQLLAFAVLVITWLCEFAASGSTRHWISRLYLPRLFFCYSGAFHVYFFSFPLGFSWLAFVTSILFNVHAALSVWNHCELPLLRRERDRPPDWR